MRSRAAPQGVPDVGDGVGDADGAGKQPEQGSGLPHRLSTLTAGVPPKWATATVAASSGSNGRQEKTSTKQRPNTSSAWTVIELVSMNCIADQPSSSSSPKRSSISGPCPRMPIASI